MVAYEACSSRTTRQTQRFDNSWVEVDMRILRMSSESRCACKSTGRFYSGEANVESYSSAFSKHFTVSISLTTLCCRN